MSGVLAAVQALNRIAFVLGAIAALAAGLVSVWDSVLRTFVRAPMPGAHEYIAALLTVGLLAVPGALSLYRPAGVPAAPRWLGAAGRIAWMLVLAVLSSYTLYGLALRYGIPDAGERSMTADLPIEVIGGTTLYVCFGLLLLQQIAVVASGRGDARSGTASWALTIALAAAIIWVSSAGFAGGTVRFASQLGSALTGLSELGLPVLVASALAGAIAALRAGSPIAPFAAPVILVVLAGLSAELSILRLSLALAGPALVLAALHAALGTWRGWRGAVDDLIGLGILLVFALFLVPGAFTPTELAALFGLVAIAILVLVAALLRAPKGVARPLAQGFAYGIAALFGLAMVLVLTAGTLFAGLSLRDGADFLTAGVSGFALCLVVGATLGAVFGAPIAIAGAAFVLASMAPAANADPLFLMAMGVLTVLAGSALHPWLAWRLAGASPEGGDAPSLRAALLAALPPVVVAVLVWIFPDLALTLAASVQ